MPDLRPVVTPEQVHALLNRHFSAPILDLASVEGGQVARVFSFRVDDQEYIVRFNLDRMLASNFPKEVYLARKLAATSLPLAPILHVGLLGELHFAISRKMPGKILEQYTPQEVLALLPQMLDLLEVMHSVDTSEMQGYGIFDDQGQGLASSWHASLSEVGAEEEENNYFGKWYRLFDETFLERDFYEDLYQRMQALLVHCPEERTLLFGGFSMHFWWPPLGMREAFLQYQQQRGRELPFYAERLLCYECHHALIGLRFFAKGGNEEAYRMVREIIQRKLAAFGV